MCNESSRSKKSVFKSSNVKNGLISSLMKAVLFGNKIHLPLSGNACGVYGPSLKDFEGTFVVNYNTVFQRV